MGVLCFGGVANSKYCRVTLNTEYYLTSACVSLRLTNLQAYPTHRSHNPPNILECSRYPILPYTEFDSSPWDRDLAPSTAVDHHWSGNYMSSQAPPLAFGGEINSEFNIAWEQVTILAVYWSWQGTNMRTQKQQLFHVTCQREAFCFNLSPPY